MAGRFDLRNDAQRENNARLSAGIGAAQDSGMSAPVQAYTRPDAVIAQANTSEDWQRRVANTAQVDSGILENQAQHAMDAQDRASYDIMQQVRNGKMSGEEANARINALGNQTDAITKGLANASRRQMSAPTLGAFGGRQNISQMHEQVNRQNTSRLREWSRQIGDYEKQQDYRNAQAQEEARRWAEIGIRQKDRNFTSPRFNLGKKNEDDMAPIRKAEAELELKIKKELYDKYGPTMKPPKEEKPPKPEKPEKKKPLSIRGKEAYYSRKAGIPYSEMFEVDKEGNETTTEKGELFSQAFDAISSENPDLTADEVAAQARAFAEENTKTQDMPATTIEQIKTKVDTGESNYPPPISMSGGLLPTPGKNPWTVDGKPVDDGRPHPVMANTGSSVRPAPGQHAPVSNNSPVVPAPQAKQVEPSSPNRQQNDTIPDQKPEAPKVMTFSETARERMKAYGVPSGSGEEAAIENTLKIMNEARSSKDRKKYDEAVSLLKQQFDYLDSLTSGSK